MTGGPRIISQAELTKSLFEANKMLSGMKSRSGGHHVPGADLSLLLDPEGAQDSDSEKETEDLQLWKLLPGLQGLPEAYLKRLPLTAMFQLNNALSKEKKSSEKLGTNTRLAHNAQRLAKSPETVERGLDNRRDILHPARFLGGASSSLGDQWLEARRVIGEAGVPALGNYDLDGVGCGGSVTPKAWMELHNPASQELKLKLFHLPNVANSGLSNKKGFGEGSEEGSDSMKEIADLESYRMALNTAREALASALPWNRSIGAITGLMVNSNYLQEDLAGNQKRAAILTEFTDYIFGRNGLNWENNQPFLTTDELTHVWSNWKTKRGI